MSLAPLFTAPSFRTFCGLACGFFAQTGKRTVCGMLAGAGLSPLWPHDRAGGQQMSRPDTAHASVEAASRRRGRRPADRVMGCRPYGR